MTINDLIRLLYTVPTDIETNIDPVIYYDGDRRKLMVTDYDNMPDTEFSVSLVSGDVDGLSKHQIEYYLTGTHKNRG